MKLEILQYKHGYVVQDGYSKLFRCKDGTWSDAINQAEIFETEQAAQFEAERAVAAHREACEKGIV